MKRSDPGPIYVFIRTWNRPLHLWTCLDSVFRHTQTPCRFVLIDNHSTDPLVAQVVEGFKRRGMFHDLHWMKRNHGANQALILFLYRQQLGRYFVVLDGDITVEPSEPDWLERMLTLMEARPKLALLGSAIDQSDFVDRTRARHVAPGVPDEELDRLIKAHSPERRPRSGSDEVFDQYSPPGRLLMVRRDVIGGTGFQVDDMAQCRAVRDAGFQVGVARHVRHRHLSLLNLFDYPEYDFKALAGYLRAD